MTHEERLAGLDREDLQNLINHARGRLEKLQEADKSLYYVVSDDWINMGFFHMDNLEGAIKCFAEEARNKLNLNQCNDKLVISVQRFYDDEMEDLVVSCDTMKEKNV
jgi:hypothetical protein